MNNISTTGDIKQLKTMNTEEDLDRFIKIQERQEQRHIDSIKERLKIELLDLLVRSGIHKEGTVEDLIKGTETIYNYITKK